MTAICLRNERFQIANKTPIFEWASKTVYEDIGFSLCQMAANKVQSVFVLILISYHI